jgi:hypothetical protein
LATNDALLTAARELERRPVDYRKPTYDLYGDLLQDSQQIAADLVLFLVRKERSGRL